MEKANIFLDSEENGNIISEINLKELQIYYS